MTTEDYIQTLRDLENDLFTHPHVLDHDIRRAQDRSLVISVKVLDMDTSTLTGIIEKAKLVCSLATSIQRFKAATILIKTIDGHLLCP